MLLLVLLLFVRFESKLSSRYSQNMLKSLHLMFCVLYSTEYSMEYSMEYFLFYQNASFSSLELLCCDMSLPAITCSKLTIETLECLKVCLNLKLWQEFESVSDHFGTLYIKWLNPMVKTYPSRHLLAQR